MTTTTVLNENELFIPTVKLPACQVQAGDFVRPVGNLYKKVVGVSSEQMEDPWDDGLVTMVTIRFADGATLTKPADTIVDVKERGSEPVAFPTQPDASTEVELTQVAGVTNGDTMWLNCHLNAEAGIIYFGARVNKQGRITAKTGDIPATDNLRFLSAASANRAVYLLMRSKALTGAPKEIGALIGWGAEETAACLLHATRSILVPGCRIKNNTLVLRSGRKVPLP